MAAVTLTDVSKAAGADFALRNVSLIVPDGSLAVLVGPAGAGKSTLLRLLAGRDAPTSGLIEIGDAVRQSWSVGRHDVAELIAPADESGAKNLYSAIASPLRARGLKRREVEADALKGADALGLASLLARRPADASTGERSLAALARAYAKPPRLLLLDEPFQGLDAARRIALRRELRRLQRAAGVTAILATHDVDDALALADLVVLMDEGRIVAAGAPDLLYATPASIAIARALGGPAMNLLPVRANQTGLSLENGLHLGGASVMTTAVFATLGVRPEHLFILEEGGPASAAHFPMIVDEVERVAGGALVHGSVGGLPFAGRLATAPASLAPGAALRLGADRANLHMFDAVTGDRLSAPDRG